MAFGNCDKFLQEANNKLIKYKDRISTKKIEETLKRRHLNHSSRPFFFTVPYPLMAIDF